MAKVPGRGSGHSAELVTAHPTLLPQSGSCSSVLLEATVDIRPTPRAASTYSSGESFLLSRCVERAGSGQGAVSPRTHGSGLCPALARATSRLTIH